MSNASHRLAAALIAVATVSPTLSLAGSDMSVIGVSTLVQRSAVVKFEVAPINISVTAADIERGYIDVPVASLLSIKSGQALPPVIIDFTMGDGVFKSVELRTQERAKLEAVEGTRRTELGDPDTEAAAKMAPGRVEVSDPSAKGGSSTALAYRFNLSEKARPGNYQIPVVLNVSF